MNQRNLTFRITLILLVMLTSPNLFAIDLSKNFTFDGVLLNDPAGTPMTGTASLMFQIYNPSMTCLLFEETQAVTLGADGAFSAKVGSGTRASGSTDGGLIWRTIFQNDAQLRSAASPNCSPGYTPATGDARKLKVTVNGTALTPDYVLSPVPMATVAESLQGKIPSDFLPSSGNISLNGSMKLNSQGEMRFGDTGSNYVAFKAPGTVGSNLTWTLPSIDGSNGQVLSTNGAGLLQWVTASGGGGVTSLNGLSSSSQNFTTAFSGTAPNWSSVGSTHAFNIPMATSGGVTAGLISNSDWQTVANKLSSTGGTMTGVLVLNADPIAGMQAATKQYVDSNPNAVRRDGTLGLTANWDVANFRLMNLQAPVSANDAVTKSYVDSGFIPSGNPYASGPMMFNYTGTSSDPTIAFPTGAGIYSVGSSLSFATGGVERVRIAGSGIGIGTTAPSAPLHVSMSIPASSMTALLAIGTGGFSGGGGNFVGPGPGTVIGVNTPSGFSGALLDLQVYGVEKFKVSAFGDVSAGGSLKVGMTGSPMLAVEYFDAINCGFSTITTGSYGNCTVSGVTISPSDNAVVTCSPATLPTGPIIHSCYVDGTNIIRIVAFNAFGSSQTPPTTWNIKVTRFQ